MGQLQWAILGGDRHLYPQQALPLRLLPDRREQAQDAIRERPDAVSEPLYDRVEHVEHLHSSHDAWNMHARR
jgi:hypothetical protein